MSSTDPPDDTTQATLDLGTHVPVLPTAEPCVSVPDDGDRYELGERLGTGGSGTVYLARDRVLGRDVAVKVLHPRLQRLPAAVERLRAEARLVARLEHPGVVPVYDVGRLPDGQVFLAMKRVQGRTLDTAWSTMAVRQRVGLLVSVGQAVAFAHDSGVVHRDLKPSNVMVGAFGEVLVLDWGLARGADLEGGALAGTVAWMAPEQTGGERVGTPADVWALGALLHLALTDRGIHDHRGLGTTDLLALLRTRGDGLTPPPLANVDEALAELLAQTLQVCPSERPTAVQVVETLQDWLDGSRRREQASQQVQRALHAFAPVRSHLDRARDLEAEADREALALPPDAADVQREPVWARLDQARALRTEHALSHARFLQRLQGALSVDADCAEAHRLLADDYAQRHREAERAGDHAAAAGLLPFLDAHDREGTWASYRRGRGRISLQTREPARAELYRYTLHHRRWWPLYVESLGTTPLAELDLPIGSYRLDLHAPGRAPLGIPFVVERGRHLDLSPHGPLYQPLEDQVGPHDCLVPPGWFQSGTSIPSGHPLPRRRLWCDGFVMQRYPVTNAAWLVYLDDLTARGEVERARRHAPRDADGSSVHDETEAGWKLGRDSGGHAWASDHPVLRVTWEAARAYAAWLSERERLPWRLPWELEWAKAARGADYRFYPWGDAVEVGWARMVGTPGPEGPHSIFRYPADTSPFGVRHLGGQASCWLLDAFPGGAEVVGVSVKQGTEPPPSPGGYRMLRGGAWRSGAGTCRSDQRKAAPAVAHSETIGVRLVRAWPDQS